MHSGIKNTTTDPNAAKDSGSPLFEIKNIPGRGKGLVALSRIAPGTRILSEKPLIIVEPVLQSPASLERSIGDQLRKLSTSEKREFLSLHNNFPGSFPFTGIVRTNALPCGPGSPIGGVYITACRINHSCALCAHNSWNTATQQETIHALRPIEAGEEITISYKAEETHAIRQAALQSGFGFLCTCPICSLPPFELRESDARRLQIERLDEEIGDPYQLASNPKASLEKCHLLVQTLNKEYDGYASAGLARAYYDAFQICIAHGDQARASSFADMAYKARVLCEGEDSPETQNMKSLALRPSSHRSFCGCSTKWRTSMKMIPKKLDAAAFEKWLFREVYS